MTTALPCAHQHKKLVNALWCGDCGAYNELDGNNWQLPSGRGAESHPQREELDEEKVYQVLKEWQYDSDEEFLRGQAKAICAKFKSPSLEDLLSALPGKKEYVDKEDLFDCAQVDCFNDGIDQCITALKGLWK